MSRFFHQTFPPSAKREGGGERQNSARHRQQHRGRWVRPEKENTAPRHQQRRGCPAPPMPPAAKACPPARGCRRCRLRRRRKPPTPPAPADAACGEGNGVAAGIGGEGGGIPRAGGRRGAAPTPKNKPLHRDTKQKPP